MKTKLNVSIYALLIIFSISSCMSTESGEETTQATVENASAVVGQSGVKDEDSEMNILQIALNSPDHTTLAAGVKAAGLADVLTSAGPLTVFAPTNEAFSKLPAGTLDDLLKPENKSKLADIITFHAAPGSYDAEHINGVMGIGQATGDKVDVTVKEGVTFVNGAKVVGTVKASNGYVHVIDAVLLPPAK